VKEPDQGKKKEEKKEKEKERSNKGEKDEQTSGRSVFLLWTGLLPGIERKKGGEK